MASQNGSHITRREDYALNRQEIPVSRQIRHLASIDSDSDSDSDSDNGRRDAALAFAACASPTSAVLRLTGGDMKNTNEQSLRRQVEKWLTPAPATQVHVTAFSRIGIGWQRYVRVETSSPAGARALFFFRHDDGSWYVFPQPANTRRSAAEHPLMRANVANF